MSNPVQKILRYIGNFQAKAVQWGTAYKIMIDQLTNKDGSANTYAKGMLVWVDQETGKTFLVKQLSLVIPRDGINPNQAAIGITHKVTIDLGNPYEAQELES